MPASPPGAAIGHGSGGDRDDLASVDTSTNAPGPYRSVRSLTHLVGAAGAGPGGTFWARVAAARPGGAACVERLGGTGREHRAGRGRARYSAVASAHCGHAAPAVTATLGRAGMGPAEQPGTATQTVRGGAGGRAGRAHSAAPSIPEHHEREVGRWWSATSPADRRTGAALARSADALYGVSASMLFSNARSYPFSISAEDGISVQLGRPVVGPLAGEWRDRGRRYRALRRERVGIQREVRGLPRCGGWPSPTQCWA
jgi:hypothetical protein